MKTYLSILLLLFGIGVPSLSQADIQLTPEQCLFVYGNAAAQAAILRDRGLPLKEALAQYDLFVRQNKIDPDADVVRIDKDILHEVYRFPGKTPQELFEAKAKECLKNQGVVKPSSKV